MSSCISKTLSHNDPHKISTKISIFFCRFTVVSPGAPEQHPAGADCARLGRGDPPMGTASALMDVGQNGRPRGPQILV